MHKNGLAPNVLIIGSAGETKDFASQSGIAPENIFNDTTPKNSWDEAVNTLVLMNKKGWKSSIVVSDPPHLLRVQYAWGKVFKHSGMKFKLVASEPKWWNAWKWWKNETSRKFVISEYLKLAYFIYEYHVCRLKIGGSRSGEKESSHDHQFQSPNSDLLTTSTDKRSCFQVDEKTKKEWNEKIDKLIGVKRQGS